ncbi:MAG TPA: PH domain-containing protein [Nocardioidaceae bacterium]|nr:PH domain-containing protein [Nocardioidaceae bacterium]
MPADSEPAPSTIRLPHTFRPLGVRMVAYSVGTMLLLLCLVLWFALPPHIRAEFSLLERAMVIGLGVCFYAAGYALARSRLVARTDGVRVVNGYRVRRYEWNQILAVSLQPGSPWAVLDLSDGTSVPAMGIQGSDGGRASAQVRQFRQLVEARTRTAEND